MKPADRERALKAYRLVRKNIIGAELAAKLKTDPQTAGALATVGALITEAEAMRIAEREWDALKVIARVMARNIMLGRHYAKTSEVDFAAGKRSGWCGRVLGQLVLSGLVAMPEARRIMLTSAGWVLVWETGLIKRNWRVPA